MSEEMEGIFLGQEIISQGVKKNKETKEDEPWFLYKYNIDKKFCSGFKDESKFTGKYVIVAYKLSPNKDPVKAPYKNVVNIVEGVAPSEVEDSNKQYNVVDAEKKDQKHTPDEHRINGQPDWDKINKEKQEAILFGMCSNQAVQLIIGKDGDYKMSFNEVFNTVWEENLKKRKEKLGY